MAMIQPAAFALDGGDPRLGSVSGEGSPDYSPAQLKSIHDPSVSFEEYLYYAKQTREEELHVPRFHRMDFLSAKFRKNKDTVRTEDPTKGPDSKNTAVQDPNGASGPPGHSYGVSDEEWMVASRAARTATWGAVFYLITTDILGPYSVPWAMAQLGYGPGIALYTVFGACAGYSGWMLWRMFLDLDSHKYPLKTYGDIAFRIYGTIVRHSLNILQSIQLLFNVGIIVVGNGQGMYQVAKGNLCFIVCCLIWVICGFLLGQVRTLQKFGWIANFAIWLNMLVIFMTMGVVANSNPNYDAALSQNGVVKGPIVRTGGSADGVEFETQVVGLMQAVYSYGGAMLFCEFMSEMRKPMDFWKAMLAAQSFIFFFYIMFGLYVYSFQGQFVINPANQGMSPYNWQTAGNIISFISALIAAALYGNIGIKVVYQNILMELISAPPLTTKKGKWLWVGIVPIYWSLAFIVAAAIPQFSNLAGIVAAVCILQFTYTFPPFLWLGYRMKKDAIREGEGFDPATGRVTRFDTGFARWKRGYMKNWKLNTLNFIYLLGAVVTAVLGAYSAIKGLILGFTGAHAVTSFSCKSPLG